jgi:hypothetical protein
MSKSRKKGTPKRIPPPDLFTRPAIQSKHHAPRSDAIDRVVPNQRRAFLIPAACPQHVGPLRAASRWKRRFVSAGCSGSRSGISHRSAMSQGTGPWQYRRSSRPSGRPRPASAHSTQLQSLRGIKPPAMVSRDSFETSASGSPSPHATSQSTAIRRRNHSCPAGIAGAARTEWRLQVRTKCRTLARFSGSIRTRRLRFPHWDFLGVLASTSAFWGVSRQLDRFRFLGWSLRTHRSCRCKNSLVLPLASAAAAAL